MNQSIGQRPTGFGIDAIAFLRAKAKLGLRLRIPLFSGLAQPLHPFAVVRGRVVTSPQPALSVNVSLLGGVRGCP